ncbi:hypothetical protein AG0111_0g8919 [Alternaria gaisen]|uniref:Uncharacterized protein n=1 Tax=Alternaria gaisen TaxID=167740 RepID=A0ACB6FE08_9PLEO|nr:hypothetical protein AG0111_0g8919 [Alternaria gaisen]
MTLSDVAEGLKQRNAIRLNMLKDTKDKLNTIVDELIDEHLSQSGQSGGPTKKRRLDESTIITKTEPPPPDPKEFLRTMIENASDNCETAYKLSVSALMEERKKASEQRKADRKAAIVMDEYLIADVVDIYKRSRYARRLLYSPATASIGKRISDGCDSRTARVEEYNAIRSVEPERIEAKFTERMEVAWSGYLREENAYVELLSIIGLQASSAGIDLGCETKEQMLDRWYEEVSSETDHY